MFILLALLISIFGLWGYTGDYTTMLYITSGISIICILGVSVLAFCLDTTAGAVLSLFILGSFAITEIAIYLLVGKSSTESFLLGCCLAFTVTLFIVNNVAGGIGKGHN